MVLEDDLSLSSRSTLCSDCTSDSSRDSRAMNDDDDNDSIENHVATTEQAIETLTLDDAIPKKTKQTRKSSENGKFCAFVSLNDLTHHHFDSFTLSQKSNLVPDNDSDVENLYVQACDEMYSLGDSNEFSTLDYFAHRLPTSTF